MTPGSDPKRDTSSHQQLIATWLTLSSCSREMANSAGHFYLIRDLQHPAFAPSGLDWVCQVRVLSRLFLVSALKRDHKPPAASLGSVPALCAPAREKVVLLLAPALQRDYRHPPSSLESGARCLPPRLVESPRLAGKPDQTIVHVQRKLIVCLQSFGLMQRQEAN